MNREDLNKKREEVNPYNPQLMSSARWDEGFNACADITMFEIERLTQTIFSQDELILSLQKEKTELKDENDYIYKFNKDFKNKLQAQSEIIQKLEAGLTLYKNRPIVKENGLFTEFNYVAEGALSEVQQMKQKAGL